MLSYCLKCRKNTESENSKVVKRKNGRIILLSNCKKYFSKKWKCIKGREDSGLLNSVLEYRTVVHGIPLIVSVLCQKK